MDAYNAFLQGSFYEARGSEADYRKAIDYYTQACKIDPGYANAHAAQSLVATRLAGRFLEGDAMRDAYAMARKEAAQALCGGMMDAFTRVFSSMIRSKAKVSSKLHLDQSQSLSMDSLKIQS